MRRDFIKKKAIKKAKKWRRAILLAVVIGALLGSSVLFYKHREQSIRFMTVSYAEVKAWIIAHKSHVGQQLKAVKQLTLKEQAPPEIHFEFYTALPKMQINPNDSVKEAQLESNPVSAKPPTFENVATAKTTVLTHVASAAVMPAKAGTQEASQKSQKSLPFANPEDLAKDFSKHIQAANYNLQLGLFKNLDLANRFQQTLQQKGFNAKVVKTSMNNKDWYRVQYGIFATRDEAKLAQQKLQKKGVNGILRKEEMLQ